MSSAASTSRSTAGSVFTDSTGMPSAATRESATVPSMRLAILFRRSRNIVPGSPAEGLQVALEQQDLPRRHPAGPRFLARQELRRRERRGPAVADLLETLQGRLVVGVAD